MKNIKTSYLLGILGGIIIVIFMLFVILLLSKPQTTTQAPQQQGQNQNDTSGGSSFTDAVFTVTSIQPLQSDFTTREPAQPIEITFSVPIKATNLRYELSPSTRVVVNNIEENKIIIYPEIKWPNGVVSLKILTSSRANNGSTLKDQVDYKMSVAMPTIPPEPDAPGLRTY